MGLWQCGQQPTETWRGLRRQAALRTTTLQISLLLMTRFWATGDLHHLGVLPVAKISAKTESDN